MSRARCTLAIRGLDCPTEVRALRGALEGRPGVVELEFDLVLGAMTVEYDPAATDPPALARRVVEATGMPAVPVPDERPAVSGRGVVPEVERPGGRWSGIGPWVLTALSGLALLAGMGLDITGGAPAAVRAAYALAIGAGGIELVPKALRALRGRRLDMHVLMTIAVLGALGLGYWDEAATVAFLFGLSEALEVMSLERARRAVRALLEIAPEMAERIGPGGSIEVIPARAVRVGDRLRVRAGERIPIDGRVVAGRSSVDQKAVTGESVPVPRGVDDEVFAGTVNGDGALEVEATKPLDEAVVHRIVERVRAAQKGRTPIERSIERFAAVYTPLVVGLAVGVMVIPPLLAGLVGLGGGASWREWIFRGLVVLVISCPCALVIGTPVAVVSALAAAARRGILIKGGQYLEAAGRLRVLAFDKTGTLTRGEPVVVEVVPFGGGGCEGAGDGDGEGGRHLLRIAGALGGRGGDVLGRAIARHARDRRLDVPEARDYQAVPGLGATGRVGGTRYHIGSHRYIDEAGLCADGFHAGFAAAEADVGTSVALTAPGGPLGWIRLADRPRPEAAAVLAELRGLDVRTVMLTGDNAPTAAAVAAELGIADHRAGLLPGDKADLIAELDSHGGPAGMVGDGVNDAPALAAARVSVALGGISSGAALETADIVLLADDLSGLPWLVRHSRRTLRRIRQNIALAVGAKVLVLVLAVVGLAGFWPAIAADVGVSLVVVANALRLLRER